MLGGGSHLIPLPAKTFRVLKNDRNLKTVRRNFLSVPERGLCIRYRGCCFGSIRRETATCVFLHETINADMRDEHALMRITCADGGQISAWLLCRKMPDRSK
jgi:hypothetical protein